MSRETLAASHVETADGRNFEARVIDARGPVVVEFMSYGCAHCRTLEPIFQRVAAELTASTAFFHVNVALEANLADRYDIDVTPTLVMFLNGSAIGRVAGPHPSTASLMTTIAQSFAAASPDP